MPWPKGVPNPNAKLLENDFIRIFEEEGPLALKEMGLDLRRVYERRANIEKKLGRSLIAPSQFAKARGAFGAGQVPGRIQLKLHDGVMLVASDAHYWPGKISTAHRAFVHFCK